MNGTLIAEHPPPADRFYPVTAPPACRAHPPAGVRPDRVSTPPARGPCPDTVIGSAPHGRRTAGWGSGHASGRTSGGAGVCVSGAARPPAPPVSGETPSCHPGRGDPSATQRSDAVLPSQTRAGHPVRRVAWVRAHGVTAGRDRWTVQTGFEVRSGFWWCLKAAGLFGWVPIVVACASQPSHVTGTPHARHLAATTPRPTNRQGGRGCLIAVRSSRS